MNAAEGDYVVGYTFEDIQRMAGDVLKHSPLKPTLGIICGTGLGGLKDSVENAVSVPYADIPGFPKCTVKGHNGKFVIGNLGGKSVVMMVGRFHYYEGYPMWKCAMPVRVMKAMGVETLLVTNAAGGMREDFKVGDVMMIRDHLDLPGLTGINVLRGENDERFGPRFLDTTKVYDKELRQRFREVASSLGLADDVKEGVYVYTAGPTFFGLMEARLTKMFGADAVGMSTVPETIVAKHSGMRVFGMSLLTDIVTFQEENTVELTHDEVLAAADKRADTLRALMEKFVESI